LIFNFEEGNALYVNHSVIALPQAKNKEFLKAFIII